MFLMYVDESGDKGLINSPTRYFVLTGLVIHELRWHDALGALVTFRRRMREKFGLKLREEIHSGPMLTRPGSLVRIQKNDRLTIIRHLLDEIASWGAVSLITVRVDKYGKPIGYDPFVKAWEALIQRFENTINHRNFSGPANADDKGIIFCDETDSLVIRQLYRRMRAHNPVPNQSGLGYRQLPLVRIIEDPVTRNSEHSYFIQAVDAAAFAAYQWYTPSAYVRKKGARNYFRRLEPVLCKVASPRNALGVVEL
ncbi:MAG TPA: DUF3800 domain-containing protein [Rhizomicrobium sp.]